MAMIHIFAHLLFAVGILKWLTWEFGKSFKPKKHLGWLVAATVFGVVGLTAAYIDSGMAGNFLLHAIGGGMATACTYEYLKAHLKPKFNWRFDLTGLILLVSTFGVLNELAEFAAEAAGFGIFSLDSQDTWRDFVANTIGALLVWSYVRLAVAARGRQ